MLKRISGLDTNLPLTVIYGKDSWMKHITNEEFEDARNGKGYTKTWVRYKSHTLYTSYN